VLINILLIIDLKSFFDEWRGAWNIEMRKKSLLFSGLIASV
jgi:hypothetical protein